MTVNKLIVFSGVIVSVLFLFYFGFLHKMARNAKRLLVAGMFVAFYLFLYDFVFYSGHIHFAIWLYLLWFPLVFSIYPIIYHYLVYATNDSNKRIMVKIFTIQPVVIFVIILLFYMPLNTAEKIEFIKTDFYSFSNHTYSFACFQFLIYTLYYLQFIIFISIFIRLYFINKKREKVSNTKFFFLPGWLFVLIAAIIIYELMYIVLILYNVNTTTIEPLSNLLFLLFLGFLAIKHDEMIINSKLERVNIKTGGFSDKKDIDKNTSTEVMRDFENLIIIQKLYKNPGLKLEHIAKKMHLPIKKLSSIINQTTGKDFSNYINSVRIDDAKKLIKEQTGKTRIENIYLEIGYHTRSTFNRAFKLHTGKTPSEFIKDIQ